MMNFSIVPSEISHFEKIASLEKECFSDPWREEDFSSASNNPAFVCVSVLSSDTDKIIGYGMMYCVEDTCDIINIAVSPLFRHQKIGSRIMEKLISTAKAEGAEKMFLEVRESNSAARGLYEALGFETTGKRKKYYKNPTEDAVLMMLEF